MQSNNLSSHTTPSGVVPTTTDYLTRLKAADYLQSKGFPITKGSLQKMACVGGGPLYRLFGNRALYLPEDLLAWAEAKLSTPRSNTSEVGCA